MQDRLPRRTNEIWRPCMEKHRRWCMRDVPERHQCYAGRDKLQEKALCDRRAHILVGGKALVTFSPFGPANERHPPLTNSMPELFNVLQTQRTRRPQH